MAIKLGYLIVKKGFHHYPNELYIGSYKGVDRQPLTSMELVVLPEEYDKETNLEKIKLRNEIAAKMEKDENNDGFLTEARKALTYYNIINESLFECEILQCFQSLPAEEILPDQYLNNQNESNDFEFIGYDVACKGGDFFSMIRNGLLENLYSVTSSYIRLLNSYKLFDRLDIAEDFRNDYLKNPKAEKGNFIIYKLKLYKK